MQMRQETARVWRPKPVGAWALVVSLGCAVSIGPLAAQQFDSFDDGGFGSFEFELDPDNVLEIDPSEESLDADDPVAGETQEPVPSFSDDDSFAPVAPDIALTPGRDTEDVLLRSFPGAGSDITSVSQPATQTGTRVVLRALDKTLGRPTDIDMAIGETVLFGRIAISATECRFPSADPNSDAYALLEIFDLEGNALFNAWMIASSPALSALEHPRYDVWVLGCVGDG